MKYIFLILTILALQACTVNINNPETPTRTFEGHYWNNGFISVNGIIFEDFCDFYFHNGKLITCRASDTLRDTFTVTTVGTDSVYLTWHTGRPTKYKVIRFDSDSIVFHGYYEDTLRGINWEKQTHPVPVTYQIPYNPNREQ